MDQPITATGNLSDTGSTAPAAFLVGLQFPDTAAAAAAELLLELAELAATLGVPVVGRLLVRMRTPNSRYLVGTGKAREIIRAAEAAGADLIVFDDPLAPSQQRNWERLSNLTVIDRQEVILDIFAARARTREAELQVALAQATYDLPRLKRRWTHLSRQRGMRGGMGLRGEGEQQIEVDARLVKARIARLKRRLTAVRRQRSVQRARRQKKPVPVTALVGYTNAGKSSLLNALTEAGLHTENKLFATLDPMVRRLVLPNRQEILLVDTVGFIRKLPHSLIDAFRATLEETVAANLLVEVVDCTSTQIEEHRCTTQAVLQEIGIANSERLTVFNKADLLQDRFRAGRLRRRYPDSVLVSARTGHGLDVLLDRLAAALEKSLREVQLLVPHQRYDVVARLHRTSHVLAEKYTETGIQIRAAVPPSLVPTLREFFQTN